MPVGLPVALALAGGSIGSAVLNNRKGARTGENSGTQTRRRVLSPELEGVNDELIKKVMARLQDPSAGVEPIRLQGRANINRAFQGAETGLAEKFLGFQGGGKSGKFGNAAAQLEGARAGALGGFEGDIAQLILDRDSESFGLAERLLALGGEEEITRSGTFTNPGSALGSGVSAGAETATTLFALNKLLRN